MADTVVKVENLSKSYVLSHQQEGYRYKALRDVIVDGAKSIVKTLNPFNQNAKRKTQNSNHEEFWAVKDLSFEIKQGDRVGILGRNGAGKSTLLKLLSRIAEPTHGSIEITGRVASLLEVGTGFHPELTGRENIYLNGAILGMSREQIKRKFDEIVDFAEIEKFLDTPVKRYSSGMYVRLAFSVAAHLEPDVLIVDEVLAVGDANFQKKCLGKMQEVSNDQARTVLFVSHNIEAIQRLCSKCLLLNKGQLINYGNTNSVITQYLSSNYYSCQAFPKKWINLSDAHRNGNGQARFIAVQYSSLKKDISFNAYSNGELEFLLKIESDSSRNIGSLAVVVYNQYGIKLVNADIVSLGQIISLQQGENLVKLNIEKLHLKSGTYVIGLWLSDSSFHTIFDYIESAFEIEVVELPSEDFGITCDGLVTCNFQVLSAPIADSNLNLKT
ncbi:MAG: ABC transporter ATP-binding protein [Nostoc sp. DedQUE08]|uniref:ABC transporter ATP-binding protein n=1 Tax=Nostoc sp. DedQUE08 TaxID=3075393 RepID=UPI002AD4CAE5|nr:ABC transporter ATP-binding protein [Nostoc sp. DedQUE08]MDZ8068394.1 ABC transporter ATP-binding protein [Nostoc sp. DedQUE08]